MLPNQTDCIQTTDAMTTYAKALKTQYQQPKDQNTKNNKKFTKPPTRKTPHKYLFNPNDFPAINTKKSRNNDNSSSTSSVTTEQTNNTTKTATTKQSESLALPPQKFDFEGIKDKLQGVWETGFFGHFKQDVVDHAAVSVGLVPLRT